MNSDSLIILKDATKKYGDRYVLNNVCFTISKGDFFVIRGNNGSGKSTLLKLVSGLIPLTLGDRLIRQNPKLRIGFCPDKLPKLRMTSTEYLTHMGKVANISKDKLHEQINYLHQLFSLEQSNKLKMSQFSKGMLQKLNLMQAMLTTPDLLVLDEPFSGLDKESVNQLSMALQRINSSGTAILVVTHDSLLSNHLKPITYWIKDGQLIRETIESTKQKRKIIYELTAYYNIDIFNLLVIQFSKIECKFTNNMMFFTFEKELYHPFLKAVLEHELEIISLNRREYQH